MIGPSVLSLIQVKMHAEGTQEDFIIAVSLAQISGKACVAKVMRVNMHMESLNAGCIRRNIGLGFAKMVSSAIGKFAFLRTWQRSCGQCMPLQGLVYRLLCQLPLQRCRA